MATVIATSRAPSSRSQLIPAKGGGNRAVHVVI